MLTTHAISQPSVHLQVGSAPGAARQLPEALDDARAGRYEVMLVRALDRLERGGIEPTLRVMRQLRERGVLVVSMQEPWTDAGGEMQERLTAVMAWLARMESQRRSERVRAGPARRKARGLPVGRQPGARDRRPRKRKRVYRTLGASTRCAAGRHPGRAR